MPVGEPISGSVINQIKAREALFSSDERTDDKLKYLSSRNAWVRVISFVNKGGSAELSENFVLSSVASSHTEGEGFRQYSGMDFDPTSDSNSFYNTTDLFGTRPRPGITSFNIKTKNSGGTIQLAEIGFVVWNEDDLDTIEQLYLRLGFEVMVEWGHTLYIDNEGVLQEYNDPDYNTFFDNVVNESTVKRHIRDNRTKTNNNVDGFLGYITNFSWSFRQDGAYECSIKVISAGAVIESLLGKLPSSDKSELPISDSYTSDFNSLYIISKALLVTKPSSTLTGQTPTGVPGLSTEVSVTSEEIRNNKLLAFNDTIPTAPPGETIVNPGIVGTVVVNRRVLPGAGEEIYKTDQGKTLLDELKYEFGRYFNNNTRPFAVGVVVNSGESLEEDESTSDFNLDPIFMPLRYCLALVNSMIKRQSGDRSVVFDLKSREKFLQSKNLIVTKPLKTLLLKRPDQNNIDKKDLYLKDAYIFAKAIASELEVARTGNVPVEDEILNIFVNLEVFVRNINSLRESDPEDSTTDMFTLLRNVLDEINQSVGYGIDLGITYDEEAGNEKIGKYKIIDRGKLPGRRDPIPGTIQISGTSTTVSSLSLTSKVTNKLGNQISIAAQTNPSSYPASVIRYREWNRDLTSRLRRIPASGITSNSSETVTEDQVYSYFRRLNTEYRLLNNEDIYNSDEWDSFGTRSQIITREGIDYDPNIPKGLIPIELSFTMDGIAGLKQLQSFRIPNELLPKKYNNEYVGFIINGLEHTIENNKWFTQVRAQMYLFRRPPGIGNIRAIRRTRSGPTAGVAGGGGGGGAG